MHLKWNRNREKLNASSQWYVSFSDLILIVLILFIMLFAFSSVNEQKFQSVLDSFNQFNSPKTNPISLSLDKVEKLDQKSAEEKTEPNQGEKDEIFDVIHQITKENPMNQEILSMRTVRGIEIILGERILFHSGKADLLNDARPILDQLATALKSIPNEIKVEGYTDNIPISTNQFPSNWELSTARASQVVRYFLENHQMDPARFVVIGYGEHRPFQSNQTEEGRQANRRVVIVVSENK